MAIGKAGGLTMDTDIGASRVVALIEGRGDASTLEGRSTVKPVITAREWGL